MSDKFRSGDIVSYPYLWHWQHEEGRVNAEKDRPVCLALALPDKSKALTHLIIVAISGSSPLPEQRAIAIPDLEIKRAGLSAYKRAWLSVGEYNYDIAEKSFFFEPHQRIRGRFSDVFLKQILREVRRTVEIQSGRVDRTL
jgi:hypothetical protein